MSGSVEVTAVILAGGQGKRLDGQDKGLVVFRDKPLIEHVLDRIVPQVAWVMINANRHHESYQSYGYPVYSDTLKEFPGPLAGMLVGLEHCATPYLLVVPCDCPLLPADLVDCLYQALTRQQAEVAVAASDGRVQAVCCLIRADLAPALFDYLVQGRRKVQDWLASRRTVVVEMEVPGDAFHNVNCQRDLLLD